jgi:DNA polymerase III epsilon subunit-like protein
VTDKKKVFIDIETSGLSPGEGVIFSIGLALSTGPEIEVIIAPTKEEFDRSSPKALEVNGMTWEYLSKHGIPLNEAIKKALGWLVEKGVNSEDWVFMAQNAKFDKKFMNHFMGEYMYSFYGLPETWIDFIPLYKKYGRLLGLNIRYQNQTHIAKQLDVPPEPEVHLALEGARSLKRNYEALRARAEKEGHDWKELH